jgi:DNA helicase HerA-like ATPase
VYDCEYAGEGTVACSEYEKDYNLEELLSVALMHGITAFALRFSQQDRGTFKITLVDEAWSLLATEQGRTLVEMLIRTGRATNNGVYLVTQNPRDLLHEGLRAHLPLKFCFRTDDENDIAQVAKLYGVAPADIADALRGLENGECLMMDLDGRIGRIRSDAVFPHLEAAFDSNPKSAKSGKVDA